jgi:hypothetical protein
MSEKQSAPSPTLRIQLLDVAAIVVGYALAALLFRAFWPSSGMKLAHAVFAVGLYSWLGLAMSGPLLLLRHRDSFPSEDPGPSATSPAPRRRPVPPSRAPAPPTRSWAELAWLLVGVYWIVMGAFILPIRMRSFGFGDTVLFGLAPVLAALGFRFFGPRKAPGQASTTPWTHRVAVGLLVTWPIAWLCLIVLGEAIL